MYNGDGDLPTSWPAVATLRWKLGASLGACGAKARQLEARKNAENRFMLKSWGKYGGPSAVKVDGKIWVLRIRGFGDDVDGDGYGDDPSVDDG